MVRIMRWGRIQEVTTKGIFCVFIVLNTVQLTTTIWLQVKIALNVNAREQNSP